MHVLLLLPTSIIISHFEMLAQNQNKLDCADIPPRRNRFLNAWVNHNHLTRHYHIPHRFLTSDPWSTVLEIAFNTNRTLVYFAKAITGQVSQTNSSWWPLVKEFVKTARTHPTNDFTKAIRASLCVKTAQHTYTSHIANKSRRQGKDVLVRPSKSSYEDPGDPQC